MLIFAKTIYSCSHFPFLQAIDIRVVAKGFEGPLIRKHILSSGGPNRSILGITP